MVWLILEIYFSSKIVKHEAGTFVFELNQLILYLR